VTESTCPMDLSTDIPNHPKKKRKKKRLLRWVRIGDTKMRAASSEAETSENEFPRETAITPSSRGRRNGTDARGAQELVQEEKCQEKEGAKFYVHQRTRKSQKKHGRQKEAGS